MSIKAVLGCLYGDEGKAKIIDVLTPDTDVIVRFQGGSNAGHTIQFEGKKYVLHLIPSGIFHPEKICGLASGVVVDPYQLEIEMETLKDEVSFRNRFFIDERATVGLPIHKLLDKKNEELSGEKKIGTTMRGIGPAYSDNVSRVAIKFFDLLNKDTLIRKLSFLYQYHNLDLSKEEFNRQIEDLSNFGKKYQQFFVNLPYVLNTWLKEERRILFEGAQGALLDIYFGTYPYVTSSHTLTGGIAPAVGYSPQRINQVIGVYKSYVTRVGEGPFPTELFDNLGEEIRKKGNEYGSTTGRPRRCGWFDLVAAKYSAMLNGVNVIALTLLDVFTGFDTIKICLNYTLDEMVMNEFPADTTKLELVKPFYLEMPGWQEDISDCTKFTELPVNAQKYVQKIEELLEIPIGIISVGPNRNQTIIMKP